MKPSYKGSAKNECRIMEVRRKERHVMMRGTDKNTGESFWFKKVFRDPIVVTWIWNGEAWELRDR